MRKLYLVVVSTFLIALLAACSGNTETRTDKTDKPTDSKVDDVESGEESEGKYGKVIPVEDLEDRDYGGLTFTWAGTSDPIDPNASEKKEKWVERIEQLEEKWNFKFVQKQVTHESRVGDYIRTTLAGDPIGDIVSIHAYQFYPSFPINGLAYPISDLDVVDFDDPKWVQAAAESSEYNGEIYSVRPGSTEQEIVRDGVWFNKTQFENLGIPSLYDLYESGEWTWDKMFEIARLATRDLNNDGEMDVYGFAGANLAYDLIYNNGAEAIDKTESSISVNFNNPQIVEALEYYQMVHKDYADVFLQPKEVEEQASSLDDFRDGRLLMLVQDWWISHAILDEGRMKDAYGFVPFPAGPSYETPDQPVSFGSDMSLEIMLGTIDKPKEKLEIWDEITNIGTAEDWKRWKREEYEVGANDAESVDYALLMHENVKTNLIYGFGELNKITNQLFNDISSGATTVKSGLEAIDPQIKAIIADFEEHGIDHGFTDEEIEQTKKELEDGTYGEEKEEEEGE